MMVELVVRPLADAFMQVGVYVAVLVAVFGWLRWRYGDRVTDGLTRRPRIGPLVGALLGVSPGCGGAIILMPLYARGKVSFGTVVAALTATMGDSSWVVIAANPVFALKIHALLFVVGLATGYVVDLLGIDPAKALDDRPAKHPIKETPAPAQPTGALAVLADTVPRRTRLMSAAFWALTIPGFVVSVPVVFHAVDPSLLATALAGIDPYLVIGCCGTLAAALIFMAGRGRFADDTVETAEPRSARAALRHSAHEASFITVWVAVAYLGWQVLSTTTGFDGTQLALTGVLGVLLGAVVGLIPGCAVQIVFTGLYVSGGLPLPTLVANAVSQDGDALIPLAVLRRRSAVMATLITTVPAVTVGLAVLWLL
ncbi:putative manganese transporter [Polymorphospora sp. NPDC051019]|uniref:putative manganese transporter n=1 Tax=Polymorphospora sp. NPDC051019 TaxID=3155725 RepID=UPI003439FD37